MVTIYLVLTVLTMEWSVLAPGWHGFVSMFILLQCFTTFTVMNNSVCEEKEIFNGQGAHMDVPPACV